MAYRARAGQLIWMKIMKLIDTEVLNICLARVTGFNENINNNSFEGRLPGSYLRKVLIKPLRPTH
jgi:hypothetical protein